MSKSKRYSSQMQQEMRSRRQLCERLDEFGWVPSRPDADLGEDFVIHIYFEGQATGVTFHIQLKSITNLHERYKDDYLIYDDIKVKDLKHWQNFNLPVVLFIWDVELREGRWALVNDLITSLDQRRPQWRENKSKTRVHIPWNNTTDDVGLKKLTRQIGHFLYPLLSEKNPIESIEVKFEFPNTEEGRLALKEFKRAIEYGEPATLGFISDLTFLPEATYTWLLSGINLEGSKISLKSPDSDKIHLADIFVTTPQGRQVSLPVIEFKKDETSEIKIIKFSNKHQALPLVITISLGFGSDKKVFLAIRPTHVGRTARETEETRNFLSAVANGGTLRVKPLKVDFIANKTVSFGNLEQLFFREFLTYFDKIVLIQNKTRHFFKIPEKGLQRSDLQAINKLTEILEHGKTITRHREANIKIRKEGLNIILDLQRRNKSVRLAQTYRESFVILFGQRISAERMTRHITGKPDISLSDLEHIIQSLDPGQDCSIRFTDAEVSEIFPDWFIREAERLGLLLAQNFDLEAVYLFGSLAWSDTWSNDTDIDLAVRGLPGKQFFEAITLLERDTKFSVDLVDLDQIPDYLRQRILTEGKLLYERDPILAAG